MVIARAVAETAQNLLQYSKRVTYTIKLCYQKKSHKYRQRIEYETCKARPGTNGSPPDIPAAV